jgi:hypothetical protein
MVEEWYPELMYGKLDLAAYNKKPDTLRWSGFLNLIGTRTNP